jgi:hypothetical protein
MSFVSKIKSKTTGKLTRIDSVSKKVNRVVARFNRTPSFTEVSNFIERTINKDVEAIPQSFRVRKKDTAGVHVTGFIRAKKRSMPISEATASLKEVASNVFMDDADNSIWARKGDLVVKTVNEDLSELASKVEVAKTHVVRTPDMMLAKVSEFSGIKNTEILAFIDIESASVRYGPRVGEDHVFNKDTGLIEIAQDLVIDSEHTQGLDYAIRGDEETNIEDPEKVVDYYENLYKYDGSYLDKVEKQIEDRAV